MELPLKYVYEIWEKKSFSKAAKALFISQPSLSATVSKLENELGFKIFDRSNRPISLTQKGSIYIDYLSEIKKAEDMLSKQLKTANITQKSLTIGARISCASYILPSLCKEYSKKYPDVTITVDTNGNLEKQKNGNIDILLTFNQNETDSIRIPVTEERIVIAVKKGIPLSSELLKYSISHKQVVTKTIPSELEISDVSLLRELPFIRQAAYSDSYKRLSQIIKNHSFSPHISVNSFSFDMSYRIMKEGFGAICVSDLYLLSEPYDQDDVYYFALKNPYSRRTIYMQYSQSTANDEVIQNFIDLSLSWFKNNNIDLKE